MISLITTALPFRGRAGVRQTNALKSWRAVFPGAEIFLMGDGEGYAEAAASLGLIRVPDVACGSNGLPRLDSLFQEGEKRASFPYRGYINADILLTSGMRKALLDVPFPRLLLVAKRCNVDIEETLKFEDPSWETWLLERVQDRGTVVRGDAIDIFLWKGPVWEAVPPMVIARCKFDNWLIYAARSRGVPVVDASERALAIHQNHTYDHVPGGLAMAADGPEALENIRLGGGRDHLFTISDADWRLTAQGLERNYCDGDSRRCAEVHQILRGRKRKCPLWLQAVYEWRIRVQRFRKGEWAPLLKFGLWLSGRLIGRR
mgnify:CR=1 FL=1